MHNFFQLAMWQVRLHLPKKSELKEAFTTELICLSSLKELSIKTPRPFTHEQQFESFQPRTLLKLEMSDSQKIITSVFFII